MRFAVATMLLVACAGPADAYCVSMPDNQSSAYVKNGIKRTICLNDEIVQDTATKNWQVEVDATLGRFDRDFVGDKLKAIQPVEVPDYANAKPSWP